ncbi:MAG: DegT/DnrJ/EryC1/StrS family aminotransferase [Phycisphaeraceae bacterium]|nr:DegT/DnrJ/EryC1/StrS family aminotransferase [Phycisphaeraceae bacterium]
MAVSILDLSALHEPLANQMRETFNNILATSQFVLGKYTSDFEADLAKACECKHAIGVSSGTDALIMSLMALDIKAGDQVITSPFTFFATGGSIARVGATPVFVDIDPVTMNIDPNQIEAAITPNTKAIIPVHIFGLPADMHAINAIAQKHGLHVVEDNAQSVGARIGDKQIGSMGDIGCLSFYPTKNLSACGDAGACLTNDDKLAEKLLSLRLHGQTSQYQHKFIGGNFRIDALHSALLNIKLPYLPTYNAARRSNAALYAQKLADLPINLPLPPEGYTHVYHQYTIRVAQEQRDGLVAHLKANQIGFGVFYPTPLHLQECFAYLNQSQGTLPHSEKAAKQVLSLPVHPLLTEAEIDEVCDVIKDFYTQQV